MSGGELPADPMAYVAASWREKAASLPANLSGDSLATSSDTFSPIRPVMATVDEFTDPEEIAVIARSSGTEVQRRTTRQLIYEIPQLLARTCRFVTLEPGDLRFTGTPEGVGARREPSLFLSAGMVLETEIPQVGVMRNAIRSTPARSLEVVS